MKKAPRKKLYHRAEINHSYFGNIEIKVTFRDNVMPPYLWEAVDKNNKLVCPSAYSEKGLHLILRSYNKFKIGGAYYFFL